MSWDGSRSLLECLIISELWSLAPSNKLRDLVEPIEVGASPAWLMVGLVVLFKFDNRSFQDLDFISLRLSLGFLFVLSIFNFTSVLILTGKQFSLSADGFLHLPSCLVGRPSKWLVGDLWISRQAGVFLSFLYYCIFILYLLWVLLFWQSSRTHYFWGCDVRRPLRFLPVRGRHRLLPLRVEKVWLEQIGSVCLWTFLVCLGIFTPLSGLYWLSQG